MTRNTIEIVDGLKQELDDLRPLSSDVIARIAQKIRLEFNYHSNAIEGNALTLGETRNLILHGLTAHGKPMRDHLDIEGHNDAVKAVEEAVRQEEALNSVFIRNLHSVLLKEPYEMDALTRDGRLTKRLIAVGRYKTAPNNVRTSTGEIHYYTPPEQVGSEMGDLIDWYRDQEARGEHPIVVAATFHHRFVRIHPFDDGNGRMARLLMNMILIRHGYTVAIVERENRSRYIQEIEDIAKTEDLSRFIEFIASCCKHTLRLHLKSARGESIEDAEDIDREIEVFKRSMVGRARPGASVEGRRYVEDVVLPLKKYCHEKLTLLVPDVFPTVIDSGGPWVSGTGSDGRAFSLSREFGAPDTSSVPDDVAHLDISLSFLLADCHVAGTEVDVDVDVAARCSTDESTWNFRAETRGDSFRGKTYSREHNNHDLEELKGQVNEMLRWIMEDLARRKRSGAEDAQTMDGAGGK
ncbi:MAG: Fic family protein [Gemmatimonadetes bacterium]|nr:Fic family protein [Gemmatimonadota bacterium]MCY3942195.1 Fic family protein [Gemmatimonadota bacterium]